MKKQIFNSSKSSDIFDDLVDSAKSLIEDGWSKEDAVRDSIDESLIYDDDIIELGKKYDAVDTKEIFRKMYDQLFSDILSSLK